MQLKRYREKPNPLTFAMPRVAAILEHWGVGEGWADPFANTSQVAEYRNDLNEKMPTASHLAAHVFLQQFPADSLRGVLLDPPYSMRQAHEVYDGYGQTIQITPTLREASRVIVPGGLAISFGWNSNGLGRGFEKLAVYLIAFGGQHNDTLITVERKRQYLLPLAAQ